jgi:hypothetical protein
MVFLKPKSKGKGKKGSEKGLTAAEKKLLKELQAKQNAVSAAELQREQDERLFSPCLFSTQHAHIDIDFSCSEA